tara:strand:- start:5103 stop:6686 length:1584 start_codon:yes stop_codon:yes gene_type:complete
MNWQQIVQEEVFDALEKEFPERPRSLAEIFQKAVEAHTDKTAIVFEGQNISFRALGDSVKKAAHVLRNQYGVEAGDRVAVLFGTEPTFAISVWAALSIGAIVCPMNIRYRQRELQYQLELTDPKVILLDSDLLDSVLPIRGEIPSLEAIFATRDNLPEGVQPFSALTHGPVPEEMPFRYVEETDPAFIFFTAGTTGRAKGAVNSHRSLIYSFLRARISPAGGQPAQVLCIPIPLHYTGGCKSFLGGFYNGTKCIFLKHWKIDELLEAVQEHKVTNLFALGSIWALAVASPNFSKYDLSSIQVVFYGGSSTPAAVINRISEALPHAPQVQGYGMTECNGGTVEVDALARPTSCGLPNATTQLRIANEYDDDLPANQVGQILIRNAQIFSGYWKNESATEEVMLGGWYHSGDMGYLDEEGRLHIAGREKDMIIRGQENIYPAEIEAVISQHPSVGEVAVIGVPDEIFGEQVLAIVVPRNGVEIEEEVIRQLCQEQLAGFKVPKFVQFREQPLPRNPGGKILKRELQSSS